MHKDINKKTNKKVKLNKNLIRTLFVLVIIVILLVLVLNYDKTANNNKEPGINYERHNSALIREEETINNITFKNCSVVNVDGKTKLKVTLINNQDRLFMTKEIAFTILDLNENILEEKIKPKIVIQRNDEITVEVEFNGMYKNVNDVKYDIR